jgi:hypothetical protein
MVKPFVSLAVVLALLAAPASAAIVFDSINVAGDMGPTTTVVTDVNYIDFFANGFVDESSEVSTPTLEISYEAEASPGFVLDSLIVSVLGAVLNSGTITVDQTIRDASSLAVIATLSETLDLNSTLPFVQELTFDAPATRIIVEKSVMLTAADDPGVYDFASLGLIEHTLSEVVPEPGSLVLLALGVLFGRRR